MRADHVGSFLRPREVLEARAHRAADNISYEELRAIEDRAIAELAQWQESLGLKAITDGEFRRQFFHTDFLLKLSGVEETGGIKKAFKNDKGVDVHFAPPKIVISGKVEHVAPIQRADFAFLASQVTRTPKVAIPSPTMLHFRAGRAGIPEDVYPDMDDFYADVFGWTTSEFGPATMFHVPGFVGGRGHWLEAGFILMAGGGLRGEHVPWLTRAGVRRFHVGSSVRPGGSWSKSYVDAGHVRAWRMLLDDSVEHAEGLRPDADGQTG